MDSVSRVQNTAFLTITHLIPQFGVCYMLLHASYPYLFAYLRYSMCLLAPLNPHAFFQASSKRVSCVVQRLRTVWEFVPHLGSKCVFLSTKSVSNLFSGFARFNWTVGLTESRSEHFCPCPILCPCPPAQLLCPVCITFGAFDKTLR